MNGGNYTLSLINSQLWRTVRSKNPLTVHLTQKSNYPALDGMSKHTFGTQTNAAER